MVIAATLRGSGVVMVTAPLWVGGCCWGDFCGHSSTVDNKGAEGQMRKGSNVSFLSPC